MTIKEEEAQAKKNLNDLINKISKIDIQSLLRTKELGSQFDFSEGEHAFEGIIRLFIELGVTDLITVPLGKLKEILNNGQSVLQTFDKIKRFNPDIGNPADKRRQLLQSVLNEHSQLHNIITPIIAYYLKEGLSANKIEEEAKKMYSEIKSIQSEATKALHQIKDTAGKIGVKDYAIYFKKEADSHKRTAIYWLLSTIFFAAVSLGFVIFVFYHYLKNPPSFTTAQSIQIGIAKIAIIAILYYAIVWTGRIYKSHLHNYVVNQHRQHALNTFETFVVATTDVQTKNAVLIQATESIFSPQHSGFSTMEGELSTSPKILEIIRSVMGSAKE